MQSEFRALNAHLNELDHGLPLAVENRSFNPPADGRYLAAWFYAAGESPLAVKGSNEAGGYYQLDIVGPVGTGMATIINTLDTLKAHFRPGSIINNAHGRLTISRVSVHNLPGEARAGRILRVYWRSFG